MTQSITVIAKVRAALSKGDALAALLKEQATAVLDREPGCIMYRVLRSTKDPELFLFYEVYVDDAAFEVHRQSAHLAEYRRRREKEGLVAGPPEVDVYRAITE